MYFNTTETTGSELRRYQEKAGSQEEQIMDWFLAYEQMATPSKIRKLVFANTNVPLTSVRRAMTNLTDSGDLVKTDIQVRGPYGRPEFKWRLGDKYGQEDLFV